MVRRRVRLSPVEHDELRSLTETCNPGGPLAGSIVRLHGFLTSIASGPTVTPSEWIGTILGSQHDRMRACCDQTRTATILVMHYYYDIASALSAPIRQFTIPSDDLDKRRTEALLAQDWSRGYVLGVARCESAWKPAMHESSLFVHFAPILASASAEGRETVDALAQRAVEIYDWWRRSLATTGGARDS